MQALIVFAGLFLSATSAEAVIVNVKFGGTFAAGYYAGSAFNGSFSYQTGYDPDDDVITPGSSYMAVYLENNSTILGPIIITGAFGNLSRSYYVSTDFDTGKNGNSINADLQFDNGDLVYNDKDGGKTELLVADFFMPLGGKRAATFEIMDPVVRGQSPTYSQADLTFLDASVDSVPEPASWVMLVGGFGLVGAVMRYRRPVVSFGN